MEPNLSEEEEKKLEKLQHIRVKFLRLVHRLCLSPDESATAQVLHRLLVHGGRQNNQIFNLDAAKNKALQLEAEESDDLEFFVNILVIGKSGVGKSATINSLFGVEKASINAFEIGTATVQQISGIIDGVKVQVIDTPGLKTSVFEQGFNRSVLSSVKKFTKKNVPNVVLYVDRLDAQSWDLNDLPLLKTVTNVLGSSIWRNTIVILTHSASAPPDGPSGAPLSYEVYVSQRSNVVQLSIGHALGDLGMTSPSPMNPISLVENHPYCRTNGEGRKTLPNGQSWRPQLLLLCYSMKILSEASSVSKQQDPFDHPRRFRAYSVPLLHMLKSMLRSVLQYRRHPKLLFHLDRHKGYTRIREMNEQAKDMVPDMGPPPSFDGANPTYRYNTLDPFSSFTARPVIESHGWDHDCGYDGVNFMYHKVIASRILLPAGYRVKITKDKKDFDIDLYSYISAKHGEKVSSMAGFEVEAIAKVPACVLRAETKFKGLKKNKASCGVHFTFLKENIVPGVKVEDKISLGKQYALVGSAGAIRWRHDTVYGAQFDLLPRKLDYGTLNMRVITFRGALSWYFNGVVRLAIGRNSKVAVEVGINHDLVGDVSVRTRISEHLSLVYLAAAAVIPNVFYRYRNVYRDSDGNR